MSSREAPDCVALAGEGGREGGLQVRDESHRADGERRFWGSVGRSVELEAQASISSIRQTDAIVVVSVSVVVCLLF